MNNKGGKFVCGLTNILVLVGAINWGLVGAFEFDLVSAIFGEGMLTRVVFVLVGLSGLWAITVLFRGGCKCSACSKSCASCEAKSGSKNMEGGSRGDDNSSM